MVNATDTVQSLRRFGIALLKDAGIESPAADTGLILMSVLQIDKTQLLVSDACVEREQAEQCRQLLRRRAQGEPVQYLIGKCEFMSLEFEVSRDTLIPRADTEILVELVLKMEKSHPPRSISLLDIGTGSGCIAVSLAHYLPYARVTALDISAGALRIAARNAEQLRTAQRIEFCQWDILQGFPPNCKKFDYIVSNPPYIPPEEIEQLQPEVREFEPYRALYGGQDGLQFYRAIIKSAAEYLNIGGVLVFEVGHKQAEAVAGLLAANGNFTPAELSKDLAGIDRVVSAERLRKY